MENNVCIVLVTRNRLNFLKNVLSVLMLQSKTFLKCVIIDNESSDETENYLAGLPPQIFDILKLNENVGHGAAIAIGMKHALKNYNFKYFIFLEDDSIIGAELVSELVCKIEHNPSFVGLCSEGRNYKIGKSIEVIPNFNIKKIDFGVFDAFILKSDIIYKIGFPKENYFMMCDDLEYCKRINRNGYKIGIVKIINHKTLHAGSGRHTNSTLWRGYYQSRNRILMLYDHFTIIDILDCFVWQLKYIYSALLAPDRKKRLYFRFIGILHGLMGIYGKTLDPRYLKFNKY